MSGRGRGRGGRGGGVSFNREQLNAIGITPGENLPGPITEPPPLYPILNRKPVPLQESLEFDYLLILRQNILDQMQGSGAYLRMPQPQKRLNKPQQEIDKLLAQLPSVKEKFDWQMLPRELRPKVVAKRMKVTESKQVDIDSRLNQLEKLEEKTVDVTVKEEAERDEEVEEILENYEDEDVDDGTDYANNYFDNGEAYEDEDDNLDDGPIY